LAVFQALFFEGPHICANISRMANHGQARRDHNLTGTGTQAVVVEPEAGTSAAAGKDAWRPIPGTRFYSRNGEGIYEHLTDRLFLRVDDVDEKDAEAVIERFRAAFGTMDHARNSADDVAEEREAREILDRLDRRLRVQEALTAQLMQRYGLAV
jgi:hypothetical protein